MGSNRGTRSPENKLKYTFFIIISREIVKTLIYDLLLEKCMFTKYILVI